MAIESTRLTSERPFSNDIGAPGRSAARAGGGLANGVVCHTEERHATDLAVPNEPSKSTRVRQTQANQSRVTKGSCSESVDFGTPAAQRKVQDAKEDGRVTPPNALVFGSGDIRLSTMMRIGLALDVAAAALITIYMLAYGQWLLR